MFRSGFCLESQEIHIVFFIEPLSGIRHIKFSLKQRFIKFVRKISESNKAVLRAMFHTIKLDCRSTTGSNLRKLLLDRNKTSVNQLREENFKSDVYVNIPAGDEWKIVLAKELMEVKNKRLDLHNFTNQEQKELLEFVTTI